MTTATTPALAYAPKRLYVIDLLRGLVIMLMALDHVRDYFHVSGYGFNPLDPNATTPILYATRWITHLCAPTFVFLSGVSIWLQAERGKPKPTLARFLFTRGLWLIFLELTIISVGWSFSIPYFPLLGVIWAIGCAMIAMAPLVLLPPRVVLAIGIAIIVGHNLFDPITPEGLNATSPLLGGLWMFAHEGGMVMAGANPIAFAAYPIVPWIGIMAFGYGLGFVFRLDNRDTIFFRLGVLMLAAFAILRGFNLYGDPRPWTPQADAVKTLMDVLDVFKYPPSLDYVLITLGLVFIAMPALDRCHGKVANIINTFGAVPLIAYIGHLFILHALAVMAGLMTGQNLDSKFDTMYDWILNPTAFEGSGYPLIVTYVAWVITLALLYPICRWWAQYRARHRHWWLSYL